MDTDERKERTAAEGGVKAALFDLDGTLLDTERQYKGFWDRAGRAYLNMPDMGSRITGMSLDAVFNGYFAGRPDVQSKLSDEITEFEYFMEYDYIEGAEEFLKELRDAGIKTALVTGTSDYKMRQVRRVHPDFASYFTVMLTGAELGRPKPAPDGYSTAMERLAVKPGETVIFEDSIAGLRSAKAAGGFVIGLAATCGREKAEKEADVVIDNFRSVNVELLHEMVCLRD